MVVHCLRGGLGLVAGAVLPFALAAQQPGPPPRPRPASDTISMTVGGSPPPADTTRPDSAKRAAFVRDSIEKFKAADTLRAPFAHAEAPRPVDIGGPLTFDREQLMQSGAQTLADLLDRVPGATGFRTAWLVDNQTAAFLGDPGRVRVFVDGLPWSPPDRDGQKVLDLAGVQLWPFEQAVIERGAAEVRVYLRSWRYEKTIPYSRIDVLTGDQDANTFRGYFAQRLGNGFGVQAAGENLSLTNTRTGGDGGRRAGMVRVGWARGRWSVDVTHLFGENNRNSQARIVPLGPISALDASASQGVARIAWGDPDDGPWVQAMAATSAYASQSSTITGSTTDTNRVFDRRNAIYALQAGSQWNGVRVSGGLRWHSVQGVAFMSPQLRLSYDRRWIALSAYAERAQEDSATHGDVSVRLMPLSWLAVGGSYGGLGVGDTTGRRVRGYAWRGELGVRVKRDLWLSGGVLQRDSAWVRPTTRYDSTYVATLVPAAQGSFVQLRGRLYEDIFADVTAMSWDQPGGLRPRYQTRSEVYILTRWLGRFPSGVFSLLASVSHEYREPVTFTNGTNTFASTFSRTWNGRLEIKIMSGIISWQIRNLAGDINTQVPGALMPRSVSQYGIRWEFRN